MGAGRRRSLGVGGGAAEGRIRGRGFLERGWGGC